MSDKNDFLKLVHSNIEEYGFHITIVQSAAEPRYAYTIGLSPKFNHELIFAGGAVFMADDLYKIFNQAVERNLSEGKMSKDEIQIDSLGSFSLKPVDTSWSKKLLLGAFDFYSSDNIGALQILPDSEHHTLDIPDMSRKWSVDSEPIWQWLERKWNYKVSSNATVITNIDALKGEPITEIVRTEDDSWEMFAGAGPDIDDKDVRVVPLGTVLGIDESVKAALKIRIDKGLWRESDASKWNNWG